jgi:hypothetical protein
MFEKIGQVAEQAATSVSRRQFLGRFGQSALAVAAAVGGLLALPEVAHAAHRPKCGRKSVPACVGKRVGDRCGGGGRFVATCQGAPDCVCQ